MQTDDDAVIPSAADDHDEKSAKPTLHPCPRCYAAQSSGGKVCAKCFLNLLLKGQSNGR